MRTFESHIAGRWQTGSGDRPVADAITGETIGVVGAGGLDLAAAHEHARNVGGPALRALTFHDRAQSCAPSASSSWTTPASCTP